MTDAGLAAVRGVDLRSLYLGHTKITDDALEHLKGMTHLWTLDLELYFPRKSQRSAAMTG
jgi:hypothetical protein